MTVKELEKKVIDIIIENTETEIDVRPETKIIDELELSSLQIMVMLMDLEGELGVDISPSEIGYVETVDDLCQALMKIVES